MSQRGRLILFATLLVTDALAIALAGVIAYLLSSQRAPLSLPDMRALGLGLVLWLMSFAFLRLYDLATVLEDSQEYATVATGCSYGILLLIVVAALLRSGGLSLSWLFLFWISSILA